ncbi:ATP-binding cassette sub-family A member 13, partial [Plecturocebus cupreus]
MARLLDTILNSPSKDFYAFYPNLQEVILANLKDLLFFTNNSFPLRNRATLEITKRLLGAISRAGEESHVPEPLLEMSGTLVMLLNDSADLRDHATPVESIVKLLKLAKKVSGMMATVFKTHFISNTTDIMIFFDILYFIMQQSVQHLLKEVATLKKIDHFTYEKINDLLVPFLNLAFEMIGVKPNISLNSEIFSISPSILSYMNQSKNFSDILEEIAEFLTTVKVNLEDVKSLVVAFNNETQTFSLDSVNLIEEILGCLVPINNFTSQMDFLYPIPISTHSGPLDMKWEIIHEMIPFLDEILSRNSTEIGSSLKMVIGFTLEALWKNLKKDNWNISNLLMTFTQHPNNLLKTIETVLEASSGIKSDCEGDLSKSLYFDTPLIQNITHHQLDKAVHNVSSRIDLWRRGLLLNHSEWTTSTRTLWKPLFEIFIKIITRKNVTSENKERTKKKMIDFPYSFKPLSCFEKYLRGLFVFTKYWQQIPLTDQSVAEMCEVFQQPVKPSEAMEILQKVKMMVVRVLTIVAENPSWTKDILCATLSCKQGGIRRLILSAMQGVTLVQGHFQ